MGKVVMEWMKIPGHNSTETNFFQTPWKGEVSWTKITYVPTNIASTLGPTSWYLDRLFTCTHVDLLHGCLLILIQIMNAQWFPMCQFCFENYHTQIMVQIQNFYGIIHSQVFSSPCPDFQPFWAISGIFVDFSRLVPYDFVGVQSPKTMWGLSRPAKFIT